MVTQESGKTHEELETFYRLYKDVDAQLDRLHEQADEYRVALLVVIDKLGLDVSLEAHRRQRMHFEPMEIEGMWQEVVLQALYGPLPRAGSLKR